MNGKTSPQTNTPGPLGRWPPCALPDSISIPTEDDDCACSNISSSSSIPSSPRLGHDGRSSSVTLLVGPDKHKIEAHVDILAKASIRFEKLLGDLRPGSEGPYLLLPHDPARGFPFFIDFLYTRDYVPRHMDIHHQAEMSSTDKCLSLAHTFADVYILSCKYGVDDCKECTVLKLDAISQYLSLWDVCRVFEEIYLRLEPETETETESLSLRQLFIKNIQRVIDLPEFKNTIVRMVSLGGLLAVDIYTALQLHGEKAKAKTIAQCKLEAARINFRERLAMSGMTQEQIRTKLMMELARAVKKMVKDEDIEKVGEKWEEVWCKGETDAYAEAEAEVDAEASAVKEEEGEERDIEHVEFEAAGADDEDEGNGHSSAKWDYL